MLTQKINYLFSGLVLGSMLTSAIAFAGSPIKLIVNGNQLHTDVPPQIINGRTMIPARPLAEALDANVDWDQSTNSVIITSRNISSAANNINQSDNETKFNAELPYQRPITK